MTRRIRALFARHRGCRCLGAPLPPARGADREAGAWPVVPTQQQVAGARATVDRFYRVAQDLADDAARPAGGGILHVAVEMWDAACVLDAALGAAERGELPWLRRD